MATLMPSTMILPLDWAVVKVTVCVSPARLDANCCDVVRLALAVLLVGIVRSATFPAADLNCTSTKSPDAVTLSTLVRLAILTVSNSAIFAAVDAVV